MLRLQTLVVAATIAFAAPAVAQTRPAVAAAPIIDGAALSGPAPTADSAQAAADRLSMHPTVSAERLAQARADIPWSPWVAMNPVFGDTFVETRLPRTARVFADVTNGLSPPIGAAKDAYSRRRPFLDNPSVIQCDAPDERLAASGSYPSGHSAGGCAWAGGSPVPVSVPPAVGAQRCL